MLLDVCVRKVAIAALYLGVSSTFIGVLSGCGKPRETVIATVGEADITQSQFRAYLKHKRIPEQDDKAVAKALEGFLSREAQAAAVTQAEYLDAELIEAEVREFRKQLLISRYFEQYLNEQASEQAQLNYYNTHLNEFSSQQVKLAHILVRVRAGASDNEKAAALTRANQAYTMLGRGQSFEEIAAQYSDDERTKQNGGELGWVAEGAVSPEFSEAAFKTAKGTYSEPVPSQMGFHIVRVLESAKTLQKPFESVAGNIRYQLRQQARKAEEERLAQSISVIRKAQ